MPSDRIRDGTVRYGPSPGSDRTVTVRSDRRRRDCRAAAPHCPAPVIGRSRPGVYRTVPAPGARCVSKHCAYRTIARTAPVTVSTRLLRGRRLTVTPGRRAAGRPGGGPGRRLRSADRPKLATVTCHDVPSI
eukprot:758265-Hanusia_phi.AAC.3